MANNVNEQENRITTLDEDIACIRQTSKEVVSTPIDPELTVEQLFEQILGSTTEILDELKASHPGTECTEQAQGITNVNTTNEQQEENLPVENITHSKDHTVLASNSLNLNDSVEPIHRAEEHWKPHNREELLEERHLDEIFEFYERGKKKPGCFRRFRELFLRFLPCVSKHRRKR